MARSRFSVILGLGLCLCLCGSVTAFDLSLNTNLAVYWGQNSYGAANPGNTAEWQQPIDFYCGDDTIDTLPVAFLDEFFSTGNLPSINLANTCNTVHFPLMPGTNLPNCTFLAQGIQTCQDAGKIVTLSMGGAAGSVGFTSDAQGQAYAQVIWDLFLGGSSPSRPFGEAVLDGVDMDIEGGMQTGYTAFLTALRSLMNGGHKRYYITAAPQCPYPDAYLGTTLNAFGFDAVYVQFYDNYCQVSNFANVDDWDFASWDAWASGTSPNKNVKVYVGAPAAQSASNGGYVDASTLAGIVAQTKSYASFGGVMLWDASQAYANGRYDKAVKAALTGGAPAPPPSSSSSSTTSTSTKPPARTTTSATATRAPPSTSTTSGKPTPTSGSGQCAGIPVWSSTQIYLGGDKVVYQNQLWSAKWWTEESVPGGPAGVWTLDGPC